MLLFCHKYWEAVSKHFSWIPKTSVIVPKTSGGLVHLVLLRLKWNQPTGAQMSDTVSSQSMQPIVIIVIVTMIIVIMIFIIIIISTTVTSCRSCKSSLSTKLLYASVVVVLPIIVRLRLSSWSWSWMCDHDDCNDHDNDCDDCGHNIQAIMVITTRRAHLSSK